MITLVECAQLSVTERAILERFAAQAKEALRDNLVSIILFGSRAVAREPAARPGRMIRMSICSLW